jgi:hypothetical protein
MLYAEKGKRLQAVPVIVVLVTSGYKSTSEILSYICSLMTVEKINDMRSRVAGIRRFL